MLYARRSPRGTEGASTSFARPGTGSAIPPSSAANLLWRAAVPDGARSVDATTRKPMLSFLLFGLFLLRYAQRAFLALLLKEPPRSTRHV